MTTASGELAGTRPVNHLKVDPLPGCADWDLSAGGTCGP
jgi:hypothetical protein